MSFSDSTTQYALDVVEGRVSACRYLQLSCKRHLNDLETQTKYHFDPEAAERFFNFCGHLKHYKGACQGVSFSLEPWQKFVFGSIYGWLDDNSNWRFKQAYIEIPRKNGKTTMASAGALYDAAFIDRTGAEVYCVATKEDQAKLLFNDCTAYVSQSEKLGRIYQHLTGRSTLFVSDTNRTSFIKPLGSDSKRLDGLNPISVYADELHAWPKRELWDVFEDSFGARKQYHMIAITTAGNNRESICYDERTHLVRILEGQVESDDKFGVIFTVDEEDWDNWEDEKVWYTANPNLGVGKELEYMRSQATKVSQVPSKLNTFLNKQLNIWTDVEQAWIRTDDWGECSGLDESSLEGLTCYGGIDLARVGDLSACAYYFPVQDGLDKSSLLVDFFIPDYDVKGREDRDRVPYKMWSEHHNLILTNGRTTNWDFIKEAVLKRNGQFNIEAIGYDRHFAGELVNALETEGIDMLPFGMGFVSMASPTAEFERLVVGREIRHTGCPVLRWNLSNTIVSEDAAGNMKPDKAKSIERIDGVVASIIALGMSMTVEREVRVNPYAERGIRVL